MRDVWEAISDKTRREILAMLKKGKLSAGEIAERFRLTKATVSHHLSVLRGAGLVKTEKHAQMVVYSLDFTAFRSFLLPVNELFSDKDFQGSTDAQAEGSPSTLSGEESAFSAASLSENGGQSADATRI